MRKIRCTTCQVVKNAGDFTKDRTRPNGVKRTCRACRRVRDSEKQRQAHLWHRYKITQEVYDTLLAQQDGVCAICEGPPKGHGAKNDRFQVDHDEASGVVRGLLCGNCNLAIGLLMHDYSNARRAYQYLRNARRNIRALEFHK